ncbi:hypothetical protein FHS16_004279 [Paenibacillus endophyticus]|uniref:Butirosin biosynthesis protein H N-terminal domain-containing protein n=1 Tax=Paenibacillus endophyticus TaxID=1294268 RepID=A0A7W5CAJ9_9BACL|nr:hypothetical protein [Paenibacillus endophyticus]MBB3154203.1 hypothetical protein [Paenibacillus endophyticus]
MQKILPINLNTGLTTDCWHFMKLAPLLADDRYVPWFVERFIELEMGIWEGDPIQDFWIQYYRLEHYDLELLYQGVLEFEHFEQRDFSAIVKSTVDRISQGGYVLLGCDNYYIRKSEYYQKQHCMHEYLLFGFNQQERFFHTLAMKGNRWTTETVSFDEIEQGFQSGLNHMRGDFVGHYRLFRFGMPATSFKGVPQPKSRPNMYKILESVENCLSGGTRHVVMGEKDGTGTGPPKKFVEWSGMSIYDGLQNRISACIEVYPSLLMDRSIILGIKKLCENKRGIFSRLQYLDQHHYIRLQNRHIEMLNELCGSLDKLLLLLIVYHHRPGSENLRLIKKRIQLSEQLEQQALKGAFQVLYEGLNRTIGSC